MNVESIENSEITKEKLSIEILRGNGFFWQWRIKISCLRGRDC
ncbi:hypothetical protein P872_14880 [Rhodonellum psychrophilum GCM71 = DSM 17998]|uniref:Uncharacterized protein n=2 Tax=Rhodonellum TaxID=336827 RepID=U5C818_9BACT|nr:hypothetical protein P872_14880 [Rhodonellum psychrophilum GCM71 = DSM 17998]SDZ43099.1 hypothetical protein SAMN05444412_11465 [Rhodonellum ikkaensis]